MLDRVQAQLARSRTARVARDRHDVADAQVPEAVLEFVHIAANSPEAADALQLVAVLDDVVEDQLGRQVAERADAASPHSQPFQPLQPSFAFSLLPRFHRCRNTSTKCEVRRTSYRYHVIRALAALEIVPAIVPVEIDVRESQLTRAQFLQ